MRGHGCNEQSVAADHRGARQGEGHRARGDHLGHRGRRPDRVAQVLQDEREPADEVQPGDRPGRAVRGEDDRHGGHRRGPRDLAPGRAGALRRRGRGRHGDRVPQADRRAGPHRGADGQAGHLPEGARGRARERAPGVQPAHRRGRQRHGQAVRERRHRGRVRPHRGGAAPQGAVAGRELRGGRPRARRDQVRQQEREGAADRAVAHGPGAAHQAVRAGGARDLRRHRHHPRRRARGRRPRQGRRLLARARRRPGGRLRRHEGHARPVDHPRAARREDRHRRVLRGPGRPSSPTRSAPRRCSASRSSTTPSA